MDDKKYLQRSIELAKESMQKGGFPAGALVVQDGKIVSEGISIGNLLHDPTSHAETAAIRQACKKLKNTDLKGATLYESLECCNMCFSVAYWAGIAKIVYACKKSLHMVEIQCYEGNMENKIVNDVNNRKIELIYLPDFENDSLELFKKWEEQF